MTVRSIAQADSDENVNKQDGTESGAPSELGSEPDKSQSVTERLVDEYFPLESAPKRQTSKEFQQMMTIVIVLNAVEIGAGCQWTDVKIGSVDIYLVMDVIFTIFYVIEVLWKWKCVGIKQYFTNPALMGWNITDFILTVCSVLEVTTLIFFSGQIPSAVVKPLLLGRVIRLVRILKVSRGIPALTITIGGIWESIPVLGWVVLAMMGIIYIFAVLFVITVDHDFFKDGGHGQDPYENLIRAMLTLIDVVVFCAWTETIPETQIWLLLPFYAFVLLTAFGVVNIIIGVMVEATSDVQRMLKMGKNHDHLINLGKMWEERIHGRGLSRQHLAAMSPEQRALKHAERRAAVQEILQEILDSEVIEFPQGTTTDSLRALLAPKDDGKVSHEDFVLGMGRILLASPTQHQLMGQINQGVLRKLVGSTTAQATASDEAIKELLAAATETCDTVKEVSQRFSNLEGSVNELKTEVKSEVKADVKAAAKAEVKGKKK